MEKLIGLVSFARNPFPFAEIRKTKENYKYYEHIQNSKSSWLSFFHCIPFRRKTSKLLGKAKFLFKNLVYENTKNSQDFTRVFLSTG